MKTDFFIHRKLGAVRFFVFILMSMIYVTAKAGTSIAIYYPDTKTLKFAVVADAEAQRLLSLYDGYAWAGDDAMHTSQMKTAPWLQYNTSIEKVIFTSSFSTARPQSLYSWFVGCTNLTSVQGLEYLNLTDTYEMRNLFYKCTSLEEIDLSPLNTSNVQYMGSMFYGCTSLTSVNFGAINTSSVLSMERMFQGANKLESVDMSRLNMSEVTNLSRMFSECTALKSVKFPKFTKSALTDMSYLFYRCTNLESVDLSPFNTSNVTDMSYMFQYCASLTEVDVSTFDVSKVNVASEMFSQCIHLKKIYCDKDWHIDSVMFFNCPMLSGAIVFEQTKYSGVLYSNPTTGYFTPTHFQERRMCAVWCDNTDRLFFTSTYTPYHIGDVIEGSTISDYWWCDVVTDCSELGKPIWLKTYNPSTFKEVVFTESMPLAAQKVKTTRGWFEKCVGLRSVSGWEYFDTSQVTDMGRMFSQCEHISTFEGIENINTSNVTDMDSLFYECRALTEINVSNFNTSKVKNMGSMFARCYEMTTVDVTGFNTSSVENFKEMFYYCKALQTIYCNNTWNKDVPSKNMFYNCGKLSGAIRYDSFKVDAAYANPDNGYFTKITQYELWIAGTQVTSLNCNDLSTVNGISLFSDNGTISYDPTTNTLLLNEVAVLANDTYAVKSNIPDLTIKVEGEEMSFLRSDNGPAALGIYAPTTITGGLLAAFGGTLLNLTTTGVDLRNMLQLLNAEMIVSGRQGIFGYSLNIGSGWKYYGVLSLMGQSKLSVIATDESICNLSDLTLDKDIYIVDPEGASFSANAVRLGQNVVTGTVNIMFMGVGLPGDVNLDGSVDISDIVAIINTIAGSTTYKDTADVNADGSFDISDIVAVINIIAGK